MDMGYARVATQDQHPVLQLKALHDAGCLKVFVEQASGARRDRPQLRTALDYMRPCDTLADRRQSDAADPTLTAEEAEPQLRIAPSTL
jgi:DNA invertase Pin-like site-specific DNA recombinase